MADKLTVEKRSWNMSRIRDKNTKPELIVRSLLYQNGFRYRIHYEKLPGKPDIVLTKYKSVIFVHGCFWHRHYGCVDASIPKSNTEFWLRKFNANVKRDQKNYESLKDKGWNVIIVWECEIKNIKKLLIKIKSELYSGL